MRVNLAEIFLFLSCFIVGVSFINCWENYELDLFDLVEELNQNFYEFFGVSQDCDSSEIKKAYRKLSLIHHPDKSSDPDAETKFRQIVSVNEVLKDEVKRARYDEILEHGLPDWRQPIYYFRRVRKLSTMELSVALSIIISIGHYFVLWAQHFEKKLTIEDHMGEVKKKLEKKQKKKKNFSELDEMDVKLQEYYNSLPTPTMKDTLPYRFTLWSYSTLIKLPFIVNDLIKNKLDSYKKKEIQEETESESEEIEENLKLSEKNRLHLELNPKKIEKSAIKAPAIEYETQNQKDDSQKENNNSDKKPKEWTDKEKSDLIKAVVKFPAGTLNRWIKIAEFIGRSQQECIQMEKQIKSNFSSSSHSNLNAATWNQNKTVVLNNKEAPKITTKEELNSENLTTNSTESSNIENWTQNEQILFEKALKEINKDEQNRWEKIAQAVPNKTKEDCINRYKMLCAALKKKQQQQ